MPLSVRPGRDRNQVHALEGVVRADPDRHRVAGDARERSRVEEVRRPVELEPARDRPPRAAGRGAEAAGREVALEVDGVGQRVVELAEGIRRERQRLEEALEARHLRRREELVARLQAGEGAVELLDPGAVTAPVQRLLADDVLQGLRRHRALHRMPRLEARVEPGDVRAEVLPRHRLHRAGRIRPGPTPAGPCGRRRGTTRRRRVRARSSRGCE
jgi:hypothetical protein